MRGNARTTTRLGAYVASAGLVISGTILATAPAQAAPHDPVGATQGAAWLARQVSNGLVPGQFGSPDVGLSIDTATSLRAVGGHESTVTAIADAIQSGGTSYLEYEYSVGENTYTGQAANATAKAMALFQTLSPARTTIGSIPLRKRLEDLTAPSAPVAGRIGDVSTKDGAPDGQDYANTLGQAFAANALSKVDSAEAPAALSFLLEQQCPNGGFRLSFNVDRLATEQGCTDNATAETDATSIALQQLNQITPPTDAINTARTAAHNWLADAQKADGSWGGGSGTEAPNSNSTGLAAVALGDSADAEQAAQWLRARQATHYDACDKLAGQLGAVAYDDAGLAAGRLNGITSASSDQWRRASAQAVPALTYLPVDTSPSAPVLTGATGYVKARSRQVLTTSGVAAGDQLCLNGSGAVVQATSTGASWPSTVTVLPGTATRVYTVRDSSGRADTHALKVLGAKKLSVVRSKYRVKRARFVTARIDGLAPGELARIFYKGKLVRSGAASTAGKFSARFKVGRAKGKRTIVGYGQFYDIRRGSTTIRVVR